MATLLQGATLIEFEPASVEVGDLRIDDGFIVERAPSLTPELGDEVIPLAGRLVLPGLVSAHHRFSGLALRGLQPAVGVPRATLEVVEDALGHDELEALAAASALEGLAAGTTTVFGLHGCTRHASGLLDRVARGLTDVGTRAVLACEVSDRSGAVVREEALDEGVGFLRRAHGRLRGALSIAQLASLSDDALSGVASALSQTGGLLHVTLARDSAEEASSIERFQKGPVERLVSAGLVSGRVALSPAIHLSWPQLSQLMSLGPWMVHTARSNMASQVGLATPVKFGVRACFGTDVMPLDVLAEAQVAGLRSLDSGQPLDLLRFLANGHRLAAEAFGVPIGPLREGAAADLVVLDYQPPSPLDAANLAAHLLFGLSSRDVESVMVDGLWRLWKRKPLTVEPARVMRVAAEAVKRAWQRLEVPLPPPPEAPTARSAAVEPAVSQVAPDVVPIPPEWT